MTNKPFLTQALSKWFQNHKRDLPWRQNLNPYAVWISEVMLQQTQVKTVIPYFLRWMKSFPTIDALANAPIESILKHWEGLGYYSRARNLHAAAKQILKEHQGIFPSDEKIIATLKGIGPYTRGAILSFGFHKRSIMIDGNIKRVLARYFELKDNLSTLKGHRVLESILEKILPYDQPWVFNEALMELGATVCTFKAPQCLNCPLKSQCLAFQQKTQSDFPVTALRKPIVQIKRVVLVLEYQGQFYVKRQTKKLMQDLYEFLHFDIDFENLEQIQRHVQLQPYFSQAFDIKELSMQKQSFTHHRVHLKPFFIRLNKKIEIAEFETFSLEALFSKPFSSGHKRIMNSITTFL